MPPRRSRAAAQLQTTSGTKRRRSVTKAASVGSSQTGSAVDVVNIVSSSDESTASEVRQEAPTKRRKLRKGTFSCTECKRRKVRCHFAPGSKTSNSATENGGASRICVSCRRYGTRCVGQEYAEPTPSPPRSPDRTQQRKYSDVGKRIEKVEALVDQLVRRRVEEGYATSRSARRQLDHSGHADEDDSRSSASEDNDASDWVDRELASVLGQDTSVFSHWFYDRFSSVGSRRSQAQAPLPEASSLHSTQPDKGTAADNTSVVLSPKVQTRRNLKQLEKEIISNRLLFPARQQSLAPGPLELQTLNRQLQSVLPTMNDALRIMNRGALFTLRRYRAVLQCNRPDQAVLAQARGDGHPVLLARELIQLAVCLQMMDRDAVLHDVSFPAGLAPWDVAERYYDVACRLVTSQDAMVRSQAGLESLMLQAFYLVNRRDLRGGWLCLRRALGIAQLLGLPPPGGSGWAGYPPSLHFIWTRLLFSERFLSLMLGLPSCIVDHESYKATFLQLPAADIAWAPEVPGAAQDLERMHALIIPRIAARNDYLNQLSAATARQGGPSDDHYQQQPYDDYGETRDIDYALQRAARTVPSKWWSIPELVAAGTTWPQLVEETHRLMSQAKHFIMLVLLHVPYLTERRPNPLVVQSLPTATGIVLANDYVSGGSTSDNDAINFTTFGRAAVESTEAPITSTIADDVALVFGVDSTVAARLDAADAQEAAAARTSSSLPASTTTAGTTTSTTSGPPPDTAFSKIAALGAAREVLARFLKFRHCSSVIARCHAFDFEAFIAAVAVLLAHIDAHGRGRDNVLHYQRHSDLELVERAVELMAGVARAGCEVDDGSRAAIVRRLVAVEAEVSAGVKYNIWTDEGTVGRGDGQITAPDGGAVQMLSVPYFGTIHIERLGSGGAGENDTQQSFWGAQ